MAVLYIRTSGSFQPGIEEQPESKGQCGGTLSDIVRVRLVYAIGQCKIIRGCFVAAIVRRQHTSMDLGSDG